MNCDEARQLIGAEPQGSRPELTEHLAACADCRAFQLEMQRIDRDVRRVLELPQQTAMPRAQAPAPAPVGSRWLGGQRWMLAASLAFALVAGSLLWSLRPAPSLADDLVAHVAGEPESWRSTQPVPRAQLEHVLQRAGLSSPAMPEVVYARSCWFHGRYVPHLVVRTDRGPYTVIVLRGEQIARPEHFSERGYRGMLLPEPGGTVAVLALENGDPGAVADEIGRALHGLR